MEGTKIPFQKWLMAIWIITSHKKGIASTQLAKDLGVTQKTAWFMLHRLRHAARTRSFNRTLKGGIEADESFFGGKDKNRPKRKRGQYNKSVVFGVLERKGELRAYPIKNLSDAHNMVQEHVEPGSWIYTDEWAGYRNIKDSFTHFTVNHAKGEYARKLGDIAIHTNSMEGYWSQLKRQVYGVHHWVSHKHLGRYVAESVWRYNRRDVKGAKLRR